MKKKIIIISLIIVLISIITTILIVFNFFKPVTTVINLANNLTFECDEEIYLYDTISIIDGTILTENYLLNTDEIGTKEIHIKYKDSNRWKKEYTYNIEVVDTTAPLLAVSKNIYVGVGNSVESALKNTLWGDNYDRDVEIKIDGDYDLDTIGNYNVVINAIDDSNNKTSKETTIHVYQPTENNNSNNNSKPNPGIDINYFINNYKNEDTMIGLDLSEFQEVDDFSLLKEQGIEFVILRIGWGPNSDLTFNTDKKFEDFYKRAKEAGLKVGVYFFSYASKIDEVDVEINYVLDMLKDKEIDLFVSYDWENWKDFKYAHMSFNDLNKMAAKFIKAMNDNGYKGMNYGSKAYLESIWNLDKYDTWLAHYNKETSYDRPFSVWQISDEGKINGINSLVDVDILFKKTSS